MLTGELRQSDGRPRELHRGATVAVTALCLLFLLLTMLYLVEPAKAMPSIVPGSAPMPGFAHRYLQATGAGLLSLFLGSTALVRWRLHRLSLAIRRPPPISPDDVNLYTDV